MSIDGILPVLKPVDYTSHDVVAVIRRILHIKRIGHTGTLDPQVTGVLPICVGRATRMVEYIQELPKTYEVLMRIGISTDTEDATGKVIEQSNYVECTKSGVEQTIYSFIGEIEQTPPMYSAVKVDGKRLYELARQGQEVERKSRLVTIHDISILHMNLDKTFPEVRFTVKCSKGTYIRTLCVDIGKALGYPAVMAELVRTESGNIHVSQCLSLSEIEELHIEGSLHNRMIPMDKAIQHLPALYMDNPFVDKALQGQKIDLSHLSYTKSFVNPPKIKINSDLRLYSTSDLFLGIFRIDEEKHVIKPVKVFS